MKRELIFISKIIIGLFLFLIVYYLIATKGKGAYKTSGGLGYSTTISESKSRGVYICKYRCVIIPDSIKLNSNFQYFLEKGFRYGEWSTEKTDTLLGNEGYRYQLSSEGKSIYIGDYSNMGNNNKGKYNEIPDTIISYIYILNNNKKKIVGKEFLIREPF